MISIDGLGLSGEIGDLGRTLGLIDAGGNFDSSWLGDPISRLETILANAVQRDALLRLLDALLPPANVPGLQPGEKWHPLLGAQPRGNVYLTIQPSGGGVAVGVAGDFGSVPAPGVQARLRAQIPLVRAGTSVTAVAGTSDGPLSIQLRIDVGWVWNLGAAPPQPVGLQAVDIRVRFDPEPTLRVVLEGLQLDASSPPADRLLDAASLGRESSELIAGLLKEALAQAAPSPQITVLGDHLLGFLGLADGTVPAFPFAELTDGPVALQRWLEGMLQVGSPTAAIRDWLQHLAGLIGTTAVASGTGAENDPWRIRLVPFGAVGELAFTVARRNGTARLGVLVDVRGTGTPALALEGAMSIVDLPLGGTAVARALPNGAVRLRVSGSGGAALVDNPATLRVGQLLAGVEWNGSALGPLLALLDVHFSGATYERLDLTSVDSVVDAAANGVLATIVAALGPGAGRHLAALAGLAPASDPADVTQPLAGWGHQIRTSRLVTDPAGAIAAYHRDVLLSAGQGWNFLLGDLAALLGIGDAVAGSGTPADPWRVPIAAPVAGAAVQLVAWNDAASAAASEPQKLRLGLRLTAGSAPMQLVWLSEMLGFDLPATGAGSIQFAAAHALRLTIAPAFDGRLFGAVRGRVDSVEAEARWRIGVPLAWTARAVNVRLIAPDGEVLVPALAFPPATGFDVGNLGATAAGMGLSVSQLEAVARLLVASAASAVGSEGQVAAALLGLHRSLPGLANDLPTIDDAAAAGRLLTDPVNALRAWIARVTASVAADGVPQLPQLLGWARALLADRLPDLDDPAARPRAIDGAGTYDHPWRLPWTESDADGPQLQLWFEPAGPPSAWATALATLTDASVTLDALAEVVVQLSAFSAPLAATVADRRPGDVAVALDALAQHLAAGDGVVALDSQCPEIFGWERGDLLTAAHHELPRDPDAIRQVHARVDELAGGAAGARVVLLLGPSFGTRDDWADLLASPLRHGTTVADAHFDLAAPGIDPLTISLDSVTAAADWYSAALGDDGRGDLARLVGQITRIADRLTTLRGAAPITIVAHSTAGLAARAYAATHQSRMNGVITLGTPHLGAPLPFLTTLAVGDAVRVANAARGDAPTSTPIRRALDHLGLAMDGYAPSAGPTLPVKQPYPFASFNLVAPFDTGDVPVLALGSVLVEPLVDALRADVRAKATALGAEGHVATHLAGAVSIPFELGGGAGAQTDAALRLGLFQLALQSAAPAAPRSAHAMRASVRLHRGDEWLLGGPSTFPLDAEVTDPRLAFADARAREITLGLDIDPGSSAPRGRPWFTIAQGAFRTPTNELLTDVDALGHQVLGEALHALSSVDAAGPASELLAALGAIDVVVADASGALGLSADAWNALASDALGLLGTRIPSVLAAGDGWLGFVGPENGPWIWRPAASPIELAVIREGVRGPWRLTVRASTEGASEAPADAEHVDGAERPLVRLDLTATTPLPAFAPTVEIGLGIGPLELDFGPTAGTLSASAEPWLDEVQLVPAPTAAELAAKLDAAIPRVLVSSTLSAVLGAVAPRVRVTAVERLLSSASDFLQSAEAFGRADGAGFNGDKVARFLQRLNEVAGFAAGPGLQLPGGLSVRATGEGVDADPLTIALTTTSPIGGVLGLALGVAIDRLRHVTPTGIVAIDTPLAGNWPSVRMELGVDARGIRLSLVPQGQPAIQILPTFSGLGSLRGTAAALLPQVLDALVQELSPPAPWLQRLLDVAQALRLYDPAGRFNAHASELRALLSPNWRDTFDATLRPAVADAVVALVQAIPALPGAVSASSGLFTWSVTLGAPDERIGLALGWSGPDPAARVFAQKVQLGTGALRADLALSVGPSGLECTGALAVSLAALGLPVTPAAVFALDAGATSRFRMRILPLAAGADEGPLEIVLAPTPAVTAGATSPQRIITGWALPLLARAIIEAERAQLGRALWTGGPTLQQALVDARLLDAGGDLAATLPSLGGMVTGLLTGLASYAAVDVGTLRVGLVSNAGRVGLRLSGYQEFAVGELELSIRFGAPTSWTTSAGTDPGTPGADAGLELFLLRTGGDDLELDVGLVLAGVGLGLGKGDGARLVDTSILRIGGLRAYLFMDVETRPSLRVERLGAGAELLAFGLPLGAATGGGVGGGNPVAANLLRSNGTSTGDTRAVNPDVDVDVWYWQPEGSTEAPFHLRFGGATGVIWIGVHAGFGPIYIDQVGIGATTTDASLLIDGGVSVAGLTAQVDDLTVRIPYAHLGDPSQWSLDLRGLALGFTAPGVSIAGALVKFDGPPVEYDGMLLIKIQQIGAVVVGSYAVVGSGADEYTSIAIFGGIFVPIGLTPIINITALGVGLGYNRRLVVPQDLNQIPDFFMIKALDRPEAIANDPMGALFSFRDQVPPSRGSLWLAAGLRGTSFEVVNITAVLYVALDRGVEIGLLGVARMALPSDDSALVSIELALKARFSSAEGLFSVQAQLTDNSWLLSRDCQLTGGFAFFMWFRESQFLLTIGGYHPAFQKRPEYPVVPRLGYHWNFAGIVQLKGESYFALTNTCVMAGMRVEATYGPDWLQLWFTGYTDFLVSWDPFHYDVSAGVAVGARLRIRVCFFGCVTVRISVSVSANLHIEGPPLHGVVDVDLGVTSVTVSFGSDANPQPPALPWEQFRLKYLKGSDPATLPVGVQVTTGLLPAEPPGSKAAGGEAGDPWRLSAEWGFQTETRMPARGFSLQTAFARTEGQMPALVFGLYSALGAVYAFDLAPMFVPANRVGSIHRVVIQRKPEGGGDFLSMVPRGTGEMPDEASLILDERSFRVAPIIGQVSEATYHYFPDLKPPAAANTLPSLTGLRLDGVALLVNESAVIPIAKLRDASNPRPLPFARALVAFPGWKLAGLAADELLTLTAERPPRVLLNAYARILSGNGDDPFAARRAAAGLPRAGLPPLAAQTLRTRRSSPPLLAPLSFGLTMTPAKQPLPPTVEEVPLQGPVALDRLRLRAVMQQRAAVTSAAPPAPRTTVARVAPTLEARAPIMRLDSVRDLARAVTLPGARLAVRAASRAPQPTQLARSATSLRTGEHGAPTGRGARDAMRRLEASALENGASLRSGVTQLWELPPADAASERRVTLSGTIGVRVTMLGRGGSLLSDAEYLPAERSDVAIPTECVMIAVTGLGRLAPSATPEAMRAPEGVFRIESHRRAALGSITSLLAPHGAHAAVGWERRQHGVQLSATLILGRGATIELSQRTGVSVGEQAFAVGAVALADALREQTAIETNLPADVRVVAVILEMDRGGVLGPEDLVIATDGAALAAAPVRVEGGDRVILLYDVTPERRPARVAGAIGVTVAARRGARCGGVVGLAGAARDWGERMNGGIPGHLVPDAPLSADGETRIRFELPQPTGANDG